VIEAPATEVVQVVDEHYRCVMSHGNPFPVADLDGTLNTKRGPYYFGIDMTVYRSWVSKLRKTIGVLQLKTH